MGKVAEVWIDRERESATDLKFKWRFESNEGQGRLRKRASGLNPGLWTRE
jgi:hypothetical protein